jgi:Ca2+-binding RTX toxin-like protein
MSGFVRVPSSRPSSARIATRVTPARAKVIAFSGAGGGSDRLLIRGEIMATVPGSENVQFTKEQKQINADFLPEKNKDINVVKFDPRDPPQFDKDLYNYGMFTVNFGKSYEMGDNLAGLTLGEKGNANITGNNLDNLVLGNGGDNTVDAGKGNDLLFGLDGDDKLNGEGGPRFDLRR